MGLAPGKRLGPYEVIAPLGAGGMGEVYRARDTKLARDVALKVLPDQLSYDPKALARFENEAKAVAALSHPHILAIHDFGRIDGVSFAVTELLEGETLRALLQRGPLPVRRALEIAGQVADALAAAHEKGIVHRDVMPENVIVSKEGNVKLLDFGLARQSVLPSDSAFTNTPTGDLLTAAGAIVGTVAYMSPEQAQGLAVDHRSDQFSLGTVLYEMLTGKKPFRGASTAETLTSIIRDEPEPLETGAPNVPAPVRWLVERLLAKETGGRYAATQDLAQELISLRAHLSEAASATGVAPGETSRIRRQVPVWALPAVAALAALLGLFAGLRSARVGSSPASLRLAISFPVDAEPGTVNHNPFVLSPDGRTLVFSGTKLFVRRLDGDEIRAIPGTEGGYFFSPFISPDGLEIGFFSGGKLKKVSLAGGSPITLCDGGSAGGSWGADGTIVFARAIPGKPPGLWRIPGSGGDARVVAASDAAKGQFFRFPQILPDGEHVLFVIKEGDGAMRAAVVSLRTGERRVVVEDASYARYLPTGHLVFTRPGSLFAVAFGLKRLETVGSPVPLLDDLVTNTDFSQAAAYTFSQEGTLVYAPRPRLQRTLVWVDRKGAVERVPLPPGGYHAVALSPDGGRLAAITHEKGETFSLMIGDLARGTFSRSKVEGKYQSLAWVPDGKRIAFGFGTGGKNHAAFWQSADGSGLPERLTSEAGIEHEVPSSFSPDGNLLLVTVGSGARAGVFALPIGGERTLQPVLPQPGGDVQFSPDGRWMAYGADGGIDVEPFPGTGPKWKISNEGASEFHWSRSGRELFYRNENKMMVVDIEMKSVFRSGRPRLLFEERYLDVGDQNAFDVSADGTRFLMIREDPAELGSAHANVVLNWFDEVKRRVPGAK